jgi:SAM-dependent methyltransferase
LSLKQKLASQAVKPTGALGWVTAWIMPFFSDAYCGNLATLLNLQPEDEVLEIGCGAGVFLNKRAACARYVAGLDHSDIQLRMARKRNRERMAAGTGELVKGDSASLPWPEGRFTAVTCNCVGCLAQPRESIKEMFRVLRPTGRAALGFDYYPTEEKALKAEESWGLPVWTETEVRSMVEDAGFDRIEFSRDKHNLIATAIKP